MRVRIKVKDGFFLTCWASSRALTPRKITRLISSLLRPPTPGNVWRVHSHARLQRSHLDALKAAAACLWFTEASPRSPARCWTLDALHTGINPLLTPQGLWGSSGATYTHKHTRVHTSRRASIRTTTIRRGSLRTISRGPMNKTSHYWHVIIASVHFKPPLVTCMWLMQSTCDLTDLHLMFISRSHVEPAFRRCFLSSCLSSIQLQWKNFMQLINQTAL